MTTEKNRVQAYVSDAVYAQIKAIADKEGLSISSATGKLLEQILDLSDESEGELKGELFNKVFDKALKKLEGWMYQEMDGFSNVIGELQRKVNSLEKQLQEKPEKELTTTTTTMNKVSKSNGKKVKAIDNST